MVKPHRRITTVRIPEVLRSKVDAYIEKRRVEYVRFSLNDFLMEAMRDKLDGAPVATAVYQQAEMMPSNPPPFGKSAEAFLAGKLAPSHPTKREHWLPVLEKIAAKYAVDPSEGEELARLLNGEMPPSRYAQWATMPKVRNALAVYLDETHPMETR